LFSIKTNIQTVALLDFTIQKGLGPNIPQMSLSIFLYRIGASLKILGKKGFAFSKKSGLLPELLNKLYTQ